MALRREVSEGSKVSSSRGECSGQLARRRHRTSVETSLFINTGFGDRAHRLQEIDWGGGGELLNPT